MKLKKRATLILIAITTVILYIYKITTSRLPNTAIQNISLEKNLIHKEKTVLGFNISAEGNEVIYLARNSEKYEIFLWDAITNTKTLLYTANVSPQNTKAPAEPQPKSTLVDNTGNIYFLQPDYTFVVGKEQTAYTITTYSTNLPGCAKYTQEVCAKERAIFNKKIIEKYSKTPITVVEDVRSALQRYLFEIDGYNYTFTETAPLTLRYAMADGTTTKTTIEKTPNQIPLKAVFDSKMESELAIDKVYSIKNGNQQVTLVAKGYNYNILKGYQVKKVLLTTSSNKTYFLPTDNKIIIYQPYDSNFLTNNGKFIFLAQDKSLYAFE